MATINTSLERLITNLSKLPTIGRKTALRLAAFLIKENNEFAKELADSIIAIKEKILLCKKCGNYSETELCNICSAENRDSAIICVVEEPFDILNIEKTGQFNGLYHTLSGVISIQKGVMPEDLKIEKLLERIKTENIKEIIIALNPTQEGETTALYLKQKILETAAKNIKITRLATGLPLGSIIEYTDKDTLSGALANRIDY
ncbi:MAG TPA: recombination mediator RecR [bacterium]|nr:recombination mediator RecR [bacterium]HPP86438.1 recombination mediator RecR [bacterium]